jgi:23S rRNA pseudouridine2605 synthase
MKKIRLNKFISESGFASRRKAEDFILTGRVAVNNKIVTQLSSTVDPVNDIIELDGERIKPKRNIYFLLNKPKGYVTTTSDEKKRKTVVELIPTKEKIYPVGRLDYNTTGALLLTNNGDLAFALTHPKHKIPKQYEVILDAPLKEEDKARLLKGLMLEDKWGKFTSIDFPKRNDRKKVTVITVEGRNHFVKRMFGTLSYTVVELNRLSFAGLRVDFPVGSYIQLTEEQINQALKDYAS